MKILCFTDHPELCHDEIQFKSRPPPHGELAIFFYLFSPLPFDEQLTIFMATPRPQIPCGLGQGTKLFYDSGFSCNKNIILIY